MKKPPIIRASLVLLTSAYTTCACTTVGLRGPASSPTVVSAGPGNLHSDVETVLEFVKSPRLDSENCASSLASAFQQAFQIRPDQLDPVALRGRGAQIIQNLFLIRYQLRERLTEFDRAGTATPACVTAVRDALRAARVIEDSVAEWYTDYPTFDKERPVAAFEGNFPWIQLSPDVEGRHDYRSGDVFISRGAAFTSAAISRITDDDANFSHLAILYIDPKTNEKHMVEAHIEIGSTVATFEKYARDGKARAVQLRFQDEKIAHESAKRIYELVKSHSDRGQNICYDFAMDMNDRQCLFCSEVVSLAYHLGSGGTLKVPRFLSNMMPQNRDFLSRIGVTTSQTFAPADIELDGRFRLIAEWRDLGRVNLLHEHDAILTAIFRWMDRDGYTFIDSAATRTKANLIWKARHSKWSAIRKMVEEHLPTNMSQRTVMTMMTLEALGETLHTRLTAANRAMRQRTGYWMTPAQMLAELESYRAEDSARYAWWLNAKSLVQAKKARDAGWDGQPPHFHDLFRKK